MKKLTLFGSLRAERLRLHSDNKFREYVRANYSKAEQRRIREAFLTIGKDNEMPYGRDLSDEGNNGSK